MRWVGALRESVRASSTGCLFFDRLVVLHSDSDAYCWSIALSFGPMFERCTPTFLMDSRYAFTSCVMKRRASDVSVDVAGGTRVLVMLKYLGHGVIVRRGESAHLLAVLVMVHALQLIALLNSLAKQLRSNG